MDRLCGTDTLPNVYKYQYKYFHPTPIFPIVANPGNRWSFRYGGDCILKPPESKNCQVGHHYTQNEIRQLSLNSVLPWRISENRNCNAVEICTCRRQESDCGRKVQFSTNVVSSHLARRNAHPGESYSTRDWNWNTHELCSGAVSVSNAVRLIQDESKKCIHEVSKEQQRRSIDTKEDLNSRISDISSWTQELRAELGQNQRQGQDLKELKQRVSQTIKNIERPLEMSKENLITRKIRQGVELVHDDVERALLNEVTVFEKRREILLNESDKVSAQLTQLREARHEIEVDIEKKVQAKNTDQRVQMLSTGSRDIGSIEMPHQFAVHSSPTSWIQYTQNILQKSQNQRNLSQMLEIEVTKEMISAAEDCSSVWHSTNSALRSRVMEIGGAKGQLDQHIRKLDQDISTLRFHIDDVQHSLSSKVPVLQLAQSRLDRRKERPGLELCRDGAMISLLREIHALQTGIDLLSCKEMEMRSTLEHLLKTKSTLESDWNLKALAVSVDNDKCLSLRLSNPISTFIEARSTKIRDTGHSNCTNAINYCYFKR